MDEQTLDFVIQSTNEALLLVIVVCGPPILLSMVVGLMVSLFQAVTQLQEATLTFVPRACLSRSQCRAFASNTSQRPTRPTRATSSMATRGRASTSSRLVRRSAARSALTSRTCPRLLS